MIRSYFGFIIPNNPFVLRLQRYYFFSKLPSTGTWSGVGVTNSGTSTKTYYSGAIFAGLTRTVTVPNGYGEFDPTGLIPGTYTATYIYDNVYGAAGVAPCNTNTVTNIDITIHPTPSVVANATSLSVCAGTTVTLTGSGANTYTWDNSVHCLMGTK